MSKYLVLNYKLQLYMLCANLEFSQSYDQAFIPRILGSQTQSEDCDLPFACIYTYFSDQLLYKDSLLHVERI